VDDGRDVRARGAPDRYLHVPRGPFHVISSACVDDARHRPADSAPATDSPLGGNTPSLIVSDWNSSSVGEILAPKDLTTSRPP